MKKHVLYISANCWEYTKIVIIEADDLKILPPERNVEQGFGHWFPVLADGVRICFDEDVTLDPADYPCIRPDWIDGESK